MRRSEPIHRNDQCELVVEGWANGIRRCPPHSRSGVLCIDEVEKLGFLGLKPMQQGFQYRAVVFPQLTEEGQDLRRKDLQKPGNGTRIIATDAVPQDLSRFPVTVSNSLSRCGVQEEFRVLIEGQHGQGEGHRVDSLHKRGNDAERTVGDRLVLEL